MCATSWLRSFLHILNIGFVISSLPMRAQSLVPIGTWRTHFSYDQVNHLAITPGQVYAASTNGLFSVSRADGSIQILSKTDGFGGVGVVALAYEPASGALMLAYQNSRIDVLINGQIETFDLLQQASAQHEERIYDIHWQGSTAFVSSSLGVRVLNLTSDGIEIAASYTRLSATGDPLAVFSATTSTDSIFLASESGVIANALATTTNQQDFRTWRRFPPPVAALQSEVRHIAYHDGALYAAYDRVGLFQRRAGQWESTGLSTDRLFQALRSGTTSLVAVTDERVATLRGETLTVISQGQELIPHDAELNEQGDLWIADQKQGLLWLRNGSYTKFSPNGPASDTLTRIRWVNNRLVALGGSSTGNFSTFSQGHWANYVAPGQAQLTDVAFDPSVSTYYLASFGQGLLQWDGEQQFLAVPSPDGSTDEMNFTALTYHERQFWLGRFGETAALLSFLPDESAWQTVAHPSLQGVYPRQLAVDFNGSVWIVAGGSVNPNQFSPSIPGADVLVYNESVNEVQSVVRDANPADLPGTLITDLMVDRNGLVWIGGDEGVAYFPNPARVFSEVVLVKPVFERQFLLRDEYVTCLAVDGGNRKWVGTRNGLWLFSETGEAMVHHFTQANSPLVSDVISDIAVNPQDGEVFVATDRGLVSYRGDATEGNISHQSVEVFPNPVQSSFGGTVGIRGLAQDATVKITTVSGALVRELQAQGGTATWDGRNQTGQSVSTGVYLLFSATTEGEETYVGKLAVIP